MAEILAGIREEERRTEGLMWKEYLLPANRFRLFVVITLQIGESYKSSPPIHLFQYTDMMLQVCNSLATLLSRTVSTKSIQIAKALIF